MAQASGKMVEVGIVLQGGGALGAYECGALNALLELMDELESQGCPIVLKAISGVSIGAINDACVVGSTDRPGGARRQARSAEPVRRSGWPARLLARGGTRAPRGRSRHCPPPVAAGVRGLRARVHEGNHRRAGKELTSCR